MSLAEVEDALPVRQDVLVGVGGHVAKVLREDFNSLGAQLLELCCHVDAIPDDDHVGQDREAAGATGLLLQFPLPVLSLPAIEEMSGERVIQ